MSTESRATRSSPKRIIGDVAESSTHPNLSEPELASQTDSGTELPPAKLPRLDTEPTQAISAAEPLTVSPPQPDEQASSPSSLEQREPPVRRKIRAFNPAVKAARTRLKQRIAKRTPGPFAGGAVRAKALVGELEKHARQLATDVPTTTAAVETAEADPKEVEPPSTSLFDSIQEDSGEEHKAKRPRTQLEHEEKTEKPHKPSDLPKWDDSFWELLNAGDYPDTHPDDDLLHEEDLPPEARRCPKSVRRLIRNCH